MLFRSSTAGPDYSTDEERIQRQRVYLRAMLKALDAVGDHLQATRSAFSVEVANLDVWLDTPELTDARAEAAAESPALPRPSD